MSFTLDVRKHGGMILKSNLGNDSIEGLDLSADIGHERVWNEECAIVGVWNHEEAARLSYLGLYAMQHRGQESSGIVSLDQNQ